MFRDEFFQLHKCRKCHDSIAEMVGHTDDQTVAPETGRNRFEIKRLLLCNVLKKKRYIHNYPIMQNKKCFKLLLPAVFYSGKAAL